MKQESAAFQACPADQLAVQSSPIEAGKEGKRRGQSSQGKRHRRQWSPLDRVELHATSADQGVVRFAKLGDQIR